ncbi:hypothetical protein CB1_000365069 [Camelus ferus]|nr:hypothetical protein CB1_000365069 [Camelus ferus]
MFDSTANTVNKTGVEDLVGAAGIVSGIEAKELYKRQGLQPAIQCWQLQAHGGLILGHTMDPLMDLTTEDLVQLSGNSKEASGDSFLWTLEEIEEFLQDFNEMHEARIPAASQPELHVPLITHDEDSQKVSLQNQVTTSDERKPTATSQMTDVTDTPKTLFTDGQDTMIDANKMTIPKEGSQVKTFSGGQTLYGVQMTFSGEETLYGGQMKTTGEYQTLHGGQMTFSGDQTLYGGQMKTTSECQTLTGGQMIVSGDQTLCVGQMKTLNEFQKDQTLYGGQMKTISECQTLTGGQMIVSGDQTLCVGQMKTLNEFQTLTEGQMTFSGGQTLFGGQMNTVSEYQTLSGDQMTFSGGQTLYMCQIKTTSECQTLSGGLMPFSGDQTLQGCKMKTLSDDHTLLGSRMMPHSLSSLPYPGSSYISSSHLIQGQSLENQKWNLKTRRCQLQKNSDIFKPYTCTYQDCGKSYSKSSHLRIHERLHTGIWVEAMGMPGPSMLEQLRKQTSKVAMQDRVKVEVEWAGTAKAMGLPQMPGISLSPQRFGSSL